MGRREIVIIRGEGGVVLIIDDDEPGDLLSKSI